MDSILCIFFINIVLFYYTFNNSRVENYNNTAHIPKVIIQTIKDKKQIPRKVYDNINKYGKDYKHIIFDDSECIRFMETNKIKGIDSSDVINLFNNLRLGAHKADLFRYYYLYVKGGIYMDIKTELIKPLNKVFSKNYLYCILSTNSGTIYQGILASRPKNIIFKDAINKMLNTENINNSNYIIFTQQLYSILEKYYGNNLGEGIIKSQKKNMDILCLFQEQCHKYTCPRGTDKYGLCCYVTYNEKKMIKVRYEDYGIHWI